MEDRPGFNAATLSMGTKLALIIGGIAFINFFLPWNTAGGGEFLGIQAPGINVTGFTGIGVLAALLVIGLLVWEGLRIAGVRINAPAKLITAALAGAAALFTLLRFLVKPLPGATYGIGSWLGLILAIALAYVAWVNWQEHQGTATGGTMPPAAPPAGPAV